MNADNDDAIIKWLRLSEESLTKISDIELATLKIHIVIEDALKFLLSKRLNANEDALDDLRIEFSKLVEIALAGINNPHLLGALRALNKARNNISHRINSTAVSEKLEVFVREIAYMQGVEPHWPSELSDQIEILRKAFYEAGYAIFDFAINSIPKNSA